MADAVSPLLPLRGTQALASAPDAHVWLSASAGTGKTHVLTARVFRLLLGGVPPENILCLTFTKAGASEMAERIHGRLAAWVQMSEPALAADLHALGEVITPEMRERARQLFARVLEATGGGLRIQTIHSFCQQLLSSFPLEAGLVPGFRALEEREQQELARDSLSDLIVEAETTGNGELLGALHALSLRLGEKGAEAYLMRCAQAHSALTAIPDDIRSWLFAALDLPTGDVEAEIASRCSDDAFDVAALRRLARVNAEWNTKTGLGHADAIAAWLAASPAQRAETLSDLASCFLTAMGDLRAVTKGQEKVDPEYQYVMADVAESVSELLKLRARVAYADLVARGLFAGRAYAAAYDTAKRRTAAVDFDDLISKGAELLGTPGIADWIRYKLDSQIDHILVDEAQDTNLRQWTIIGALVDEYFAGEGAGGEKMRTLFTVGDHKQAIFGFQGTSPQAFADAHDHFRTLASEVGHDFHDLSLDESFRSMPAVLDVVDAMVGTLGAEALGLSPQAVAHESVKQFPGVVGLLKPVSAVPGEDDAAEGEPEGDEDWLADQDRLLADRIAAQVKQWLDAGTMLESQGRALRPGDIMILLRKRGALARLIVARLYEAGVPVAGVDRLRLQAPLGVQDLMAVLRFASQPEDDLNLACLLVSPLIGWTQDELMERAVPRMGSLWRHLRENPAVPPDDLTILYDILARADFITPYRQLETILSGPVQGRRKLVARLGTEALDSIEELLSAALHFEQQDQPSIQRFIDWFDREEGDIKREGDSGEDAVRLLTVHGAKGLQAPLVILADACANPDDADKPGSLDVTVDEDAKLSFLPPRKAERWGVIDAAMEINKSGERQEHWRLLYVAMTRAEEQLFVTGALGRRAKGTIPPESWFAAIEGAMASLGADWREDSLWNARMLWRGATELAAKAPSRDRGEASADRPPLPQWAREVPAKEARPSRPLAPTAPLDDDQPYPPPSPAMAQAALRGRVFHSLFERLPDVAPDERRAVALQWLGRNAAALGEEARASIVEDALAIIADPANADLFGPNALAEAPVAAVVGEEVVSGVIDRLIVGADEIRLVDFKTGSRVPATAQDVPLAHVRQMAAYVAALEVVFPDRRVDATLLYTSGPSLVPLGKDVLAPHKPGFAPKH
ncbi:MAG: double-strand break repair helicase AddA [Sphingobium sp.]